MTFLQNSFYKEEQILEEYEKENNRYVNDIGNQLSHFLWIVRLLTLSAINLLIYSQSSTDGRP